MKGQWFLRVQKLPYYFLVIVLVMVICWAIVPEKIFKIASVIVREAVVKIPILINAVRV
jgi:hypothetical protein